MSNAGHLSLNRWVDLCATTPARRLGFQNKGHLGVGYDADVVVFDPERPFALSPDTLHENVDWTPYDGLTGREVERIGSSSAVSLALRSREQIGSSGLSVSRNRRG